jgi:hypothetical protein
LDQSAEHLIAPGYWMSASYPLVLYSVYRVEQPGGRLYRRMKAGDLWIVHVILFAPFGVVRLLCASPALQPCEPCAW